MAEGHGTGKLLTLGSREAEKETGKEPGIRCTLWRHGPRYIPPPTRSHLLTVYSAMSSSMD
jgi:hypothetical protein